ncbi:phage tail protein [Escherichia coli]|uniref:phage tail protein n=1 Tax=Escherichia coli TaxID=562 RepID=UPI0019CBC966|nr:phage tail protein [Escherichia coli]EEW0697883.1 phage tail protein [Escherichia coli]EGD0449340.1 phage tail protein [Escherichia coli]UMV85310.1 phage tail protein [Escherichia coli]
MTVSTEVGHNEYTGNGVTTTFPYTFRVFDKSDLVVQIVDLEENITVLVLDTDYSVTGVGGYNGGNVMLRTALTSGYRIFVSRELPVTQETDLRNQGKFLAEVHEDAFDKLTMLIQQVFYNLSKVIKVPESGNWLVPTIRLRKNKIFAWDEEGNPIAVSPESGSASDVMIELAKSSGAGLIGTTSGGTVQSVLDDCHARLITCERNSRVENFYTLAETCTAELLSLNAPEAYDKSITLTVNEELTTDYTGPVTGHCSVGNPQNYTIAMCTSTTLEYQVSSVVLESDGTFSFARSWTGAKSFKLYRTSNNGLATVWEDPLCIRSYRMPSDAGDETVRVMKDRTYTYDQAVSAIALMAQGNSQVEQFVRGLCAIVGSGGSEGSVPFFVNRMSAQTSSQYYRTGNAAWVAYALAYYLLKYPDGEMAVVARDKLTQCAEWIETFRVADNGDIRYGLYTSGSGRYLDGVFYPDFKADWCTSEHQFDLWFLFDLMGRVGFTGYAEKAKALADAIMEKLWVEDEGRFYAGMRTTGVDKASPLDCASWGGLFVANIDMEKARRCFTYLDRFWYATHDATGYTPYHPEYGYPNKQRGVWVEGSAGVALLARRLGDDATAMDILARLAPLRTRYGYIDSSDYPDNDDMPPWPSSCNTAWMILACDPQGFWNVGVSSLSGRYYRY